MKGRKGDGGKRRAGETVTGRMGEAEKDKFAGSPFHRFSGSLNAGSPFPRFCISPFPRFTGSPVHHFFTE
jgi:hypothetical protein